MYCTVLYFTVLYNPILYSMIVPASLPDHCPSSGPFVQSRIVTETKGMDCLLYTTLTCRIKVQLANSLEYPERIQRGLEWTQLLKRLSVLCLLVSKFSLFLYYKVL